VILDRLDVHTRGSRLDALVRRARERNYCDPDIRANMQFDQIHLAKGSSAMDGMRTTSLVVTLCMLLCACATPYQNGGFRGGFSETQTAPDGFLVTFRGNAFASEERALDFLLLRSAQLTVDHGFNYFVIIGTASGSSTSVVSTPSVTTSTFSGNTINSVTYPGATFVAHKPRVSAAIKCFTVNPRGNAYDATFLLHSIETKYGMLK
jgi:hypothetical protein